MTPTQVILMVVAILAVAAVAVFAMKTRRTQRLRERFGPEYSRAIEESGSPTKGEARLAQLEKKVERYKIRALSTAEQDRFVESWRQVQARFVDDPNGSLQEADRLVSDVMSTRGYPMADFEEQASDLTVHHARVVEHYRAGHEIAVRQKQGHATTEELRQAMIHYRQLFDELIEGRQRVPAGSKVATA